jgi:N-alpha-acetyl-L-2,4-diaminobutyrate deacetylase
MLIACRPRRSRHVDFGRDGVQHGHLRLPYSAAMIQRLGFGDDPDLRDPNGEGPTALLTGANHGDEYEGPAALFELARTLDPEKFAAGDHRAGDELSGLPPGTRTSPIDKGNLNRSFPGRPDGTVTEKIADYFTRHLLPLADIVLDFHSGGRTLDFLPFAAASSPVSMMVCWKCAGIWATTSARAR